MIFSTPDEIVSADDLLYRTWLTIDRCPRRTMCAVPTRAVPDATNKAVVVYATTQFSSVRTFIVRRSNSLHSHECNAVKSRPEAKRNSDVFSLRWNCPSVGVASRND